MKNKDRIQEPDRKEESDGKGTQGRSVTYEVFSIIGYVLIVVAISLLFLKYVGQRTQVSGQSMEDTLHDKDNLIVDKITYRFKDPKRFDIIVFPYRYQKDTFYIKRIIGLPGETVMIEDGIIYINGEPLEEDYGKEVIEDSGRAGELITLGDDEYFVMGDNRNHSKDSRATDVGNIKGDEIVGRAWVRIWPFNKIGVLKHQ
ncbi:MAG TPA: signal peptidase I [Candidatus Merdenecus merdavium]|nr:signal peptidase I [Candidatus Merdenecus merdavium]